MEIVVDSREKGSSEFKDSRAERARQYFKQYTPDVCIEQLEFGDYLFIEDGKKVVFEFKTLHDYFNSLTNGSLFEECANMSASYPYSFLIVQGCLPEYCIEVSDYYEDDDRLNKMYKGSLRRLRTMTNVITGILDENEVFEEMYQQALKCFNLKSYGGCKRSIPSNDIVDYTLSGCSGVSHQIIKNIRKEIPELKTLNDLLNLTVEDFKRVNKIGDKKANNIYVWLHE